jgi:hypothetical protein
LEQQQVNAPVELTRYTITDQHYDPMHARNAFDVYLAVEADRLLSTLKEQLANAQSGAKFAREHLERAREQIAEMGKYATHKEYCDHRKFWVVDSVCTCGLEALASLPGSEAV